MIEKLTATIEKITEIYIKKKKTIFFLFLFLKENNYLNDNERKTVIALKY